MLRQMPSDARCRITFTFTCERASECEPGRQVECVVGQLCCVRERRAHDLLNELICPPEQRRRIRKLVVKRPKADT